MGTILLKGWVESHGVEGDPGIREQRRVEGNPEK
jgi:hypothetical protein